jgi:hypothetical protein
MIVRPLSAHFPRYFIIMASLAKNLINMSLRYQQYPNITTSLANRIYNSIPQCYFNCLQVMQHQLAQYRKQRTLLAHPRVTKADFMAYLHSVHKGDVVFLQPICDFEMHDEGAPESQPLFE